MAGIFDHSNIPSVLIKSVEYFDELSDSPSSEGCVYYSRGQLEYFSGSSAPINLRILRTCRPERTLGPVRQ